MRINFFVKYLKFCVDSRNAEKFRKTFFAFEIIAFELVPLNTRFYWENILVIGFHSTNKKFQDLWYFQKRVYMADLRWEWSKNIKKILPRACKQRFETCNMLTLHKCSDTGFSWLLSNSDFSSQYFEKEITSEAQLFFLKDSKFYVDSVNSEKNWE